MLNVRQKEKRKNTEAFMGVVKEDVSVTEEDARYMV